jgi:hypothetical protein
MYYKYFELVWFLITRRLLRPGLTRLMADSSPPKNPPAGPSCTRVDLLGSPRPYTTSRPSTTPERPKSSTSITSIPASPLYPGLNDENTRKFRTAFRSTESKVNYTMELLALMGVEMPKEKVVEFIARWPEQLPDTKTFSKLTTEDYRKLCRFIYDDIKVNDDFLLEHIPDSIIPPEFLAMLRITRLVSSRTTEMGTWNVINLFMNAAVYIARSVFGEERLVINHEVDTDPIDVPEIGSVSGPLDYITSRLAGKIPMGTCPK